MCCSAVTDWLNKANVARTGDPIGLLLMFAVTKQPATETRANRATNLTMPNILGFRVVRDQPNPDPTALLFEMSPQDALVAEVLKDAGGTIDFTLRSPQDVDTFKTEAIKTRCSTTSTCEHPVELTPTSGIKPELLQERCCH